MVIESKVTFHNDKLSKILDIFAMHDITLQERLPKLLANLGMSAGSNNPFRELMDLPITGPIDFGL